MQNAQRKINALLDRRLKEKGPFRVRINFVNLGLWCVKTSNGEIILNLWKIRILIKTRGN